MICKLLLPWCQGKEIIKNKLRPVCQPQKKVKKEIQTIKEKGSNKRYVDLACTNKTSKQLANDASFLDEKATETIDKVFNKIHLKCKELVINEPNASKVRKSMNTLVEDVSCKEHTEYESSQENPADVSKPWKSLCADRDMVLPKVPKKKKYYLAMIIASFGKTNQVSTHNDSISAGARIIIFDARESKHKPKSLGCFVAGRFNYNDKFLMLFRNHLKENEECDEDFLCVKCHCLH